MAMSYEEVARRLGNRTAVQIDKRRGTEFRISPTHLPFYGQADDAPANPDLEVRYRGFPVVTLHPDHTYTLRTGGLATKTTLRRISEYSPISLVTRGGTVYVHNPEPGKESLRPFIEGMRVDRFGRMIEAPGVGALTPHPPADAADSSASTADPLEARLSALLDAKLAELGLSGHKAAPQAPQARPAPVRAVRLRALVNTASTPERDLTQPGVPRVDAVGTLIENAMRANGLPEDQVQRITRDFRAALYRGRMPEPEGPIAPSAPRPRRKVERSTTPTIKCAECGVDLPAHYDGANRFRGCAWAAKQTAK